MSAPRRLAALTTEEAAGALCAGTVLLLPIGSLEAHGPHLPLETDVIIAVETARRAGELLAARGITALLLPPLAYSTAECARSFAGTASVPPDAVTSQIGAIARALAPGGGPLLCLVNAHLEPAHLRALRAAVSDAEGSGCRIVFPDQTRRPNVEAFGEEFRLGGGHAGGYETSLVLAAGGRVDDAVRRGLAPNPVDLAAALRSGPADFRAVGGARAYFGDPAAASGEEGERLYSLLACMVVQAAVAALESSPPVS